MNVSDKIIRGFIKGEAKATEKVYIEYKNLMYFVIANYVDSVEDCQDLLNDAFLKAMEGARTLDNIDNLKSYLAKIAKNTALDFLKKKKDIPMSGLVEEMYGDDDRTNSLLNDLEYLLRNKETIVTYLRAGFDYTWEEIREETGIPESTAKRLYSASKEKLRKEFL